LAGAVAGWFGTPISILAGGIITTLSALWLARRLQIRPRESMPGRVRNVAH
jgi:hypothetical protein